MTRWGWVMSAGSLALCMSSAARDRGTWIGTWASSPTAVPTAANSGTDTPDDSVIARGTIRYRLRISQGGSRIRLRFTNEFGTSPLVLTAATVGMAADGLNAVPGSMREITFAGSPSIAIPAGAPALSDAVNLPVKTLADVLVSVYVGEGMTLFTCNAAHATADQGLVQGSDSTHSDRSPAYACLVTIRPIVSEIDVLSEHRRPVVVALGDSITDGRLIAETGDRGWPGVLSRRLQATGISVVNAGIGGNRLLESMSTYGASALSRLDRDVLTVPGVSHILLLEGTNDIGMSGPGGIFGDTPLADPRAVVGAYSQIVARAHERGIKVIGATLPPFGGSLYYTADRERVRTAVNEWIRTPGNFDGIVDFAAAMDDPGNVGSLKPPYDSGDHLHPGPDGYRLMGELIDLGLFRP